MKKILIVLIIIAFPLIFVIFSPGEADFRNYDLISNFADGVMVSMDGNSLIERCFEPPERIPAGKALLKKLSKIFTNPNLKFNHEKSETISYSPDGDFGIRLSLPKKTEKSSSFTIIFKKTSGKTYNKIVIDTHHEGMIRFHSIVDGQSSVIAEAGSGFIPDEEYTLFALMTGNRLHIIANGELIVNTLDPKRKNSGVVELNPKVMKASGKFAIKIADIDEGDLFSVSSMIHKANVWCGTDAQPIFTEKRGAPANFVYIQIADESRRAIAVPARGKISYNITVPPNSSLEFEFNRADCRNGSGINLSLRLSISSGDKNLINKVYEVQTRNEWRMNRVSLDNWVDENLTITLSVEAEQNDKQTGEDIIFIANPIIRTVKEPDEKNVLLILLDTLRPDHLGCYGYTRNTSPNIDKLAAEGVLFRNAFAHASWTLPSHMSLFGSLYPYESTKILGSVLEESNYSKLAPEVKTIAEFMKGFGYKTLAATGSGYVNSTWGFSQGFEQYWNNQGKEADEDIFLSTPLFNKWVKENRNQKWFIFFHTFEVHSPYSRRHFTPRESDGEAKETIANYDSGILFADKYIGMLIDTLRENSILDDTIIIITSDHGESFYDQSSGKPEYPDKGKHGHNLYDKLIRVPLIIYGLDKPYRGKIIDKMVSLADILPTILDLTGNDPPEGIRGRSVLPILDDEGDWEELVYSEALRADIESGKKSLRTAHYKYIRNSKYRKDKNKVEFYDLKNDTQEKINLAESDNHKKRLRIFKNKMEEIISTIIARRALIDKKIKAGEISPELKKHLTKLGYLDY